LRVQSARKFILWNFQFLSWEDGVRRFEMIKFGQLAPGHVEAPGDIDQGITALHSIDFVSFG
jgi:hypothetical protein